MNKLIIVGGSVFITIWILSFVSPVQVYLNNPDNLVIGISVLALMILGGVIALIGMVKSSKK
jgi:hypothetical protein